MEESTKEIEQICARCKLFIRHYARCGSYLVETQHGHCSKPHKKITVPTDTCQHWQNGEQKQKEKADSLLSALTQICHRLTEIATILNTELSE